MHGRLIQVELHCAWFLEVAQHQLAFPNICLFAFLRDHHDYFLVHSQLIILLASTLYIYSFSVHNTALIQRKVNMECSIIYIRTCPVII